MTSIINEDIDPDVPIWQQQYPDESGETPTSRRVSELLRGMTPDPVDLNDLSFDFDGPVGPGGDIDTSYTDSYITELIRANLMSGQIDSGQAIADLIDLVRLDYDEAEETLLGWGPVPETGDDYGFDRGGSSSLGGGRRGGATREYIGPDRGLVEDWVKQQLINKVGRANGDRIQMLTDVYMADDKKNFGITKGEGIDPKQSVIEKIREFDDYKRIHAMRSDADDEDTWISGQMSQLLDAGVSSAEAEKLAINFAQAGVAQARAGELSEARRIGTAPNQALPGFFRSVHENLSTIARSMR